MRIFGYLKNDDDNRARERLTEAFKVFDKDEMGSIPLNDIRSILTTIGEPLSYDQVDELFQFVRVDDSGRFKSADFIQMLLTKWK